MAEILDKPMLAIGLMSGTSCDGLDAALIETDGKQVVRSVATAFRPYKEEEQLLLRDAIKDAAGMTDRNARPGCLAEAEAFLTRAHQEVVNLLLQGQAAQGLTPDIIGFHGQTVWHNPAEGVTVQLGDGQALADACGVPVVYDFRKNDVDAGGQGAPLAPAYHAVLQQSLDLRLPMAFVNIGGVSNITWIGGTGALMAFDCGPGNALINDLVLEKTGWDMDRGGAIAAKGTTDALALITMMGNPYFKAPAPKSLDRNGFDLSAIAGLEFEDAVATLTSFTTETISLGLDLCERLEGHGAEMVVVCGGGQHNDTMMGQLNTILEMPVMTAEDLGWRGDAMEAEAFAYLAVRSKLGLPISYPGTTGVKRPLTGGIYVAPKGRS